MGLDQTSDIEKKKTPYSNSYHSTHYLINFFFILSYFFPKFRAKVVVLVASGTGGVMCMLTDIPKVQVYSFIALMCAGMGANIINAATVELYPTAMR